MKKKKLITSALPYVNNVPHLGNLLGSLLSADAFARFCRLQGHETLFIGGTDEYGTATEMKAFAEKKTPREICDHFFKMHEQIYQWFNLSFDHFGRTSTPLHESMTQEIFKDLFKNSYIEARSSEQFYDESLQSFLADRYIQGECPFCHFLKATGDQCDQCGHLLTPQALINPISVISQQKPKLKSTEHLYLKLPNLQEEVRNWLMKAIEDGFWSSNAVAISLAWLKEGLEHRSITRDLRWGVPVPQKGFEQKVFYVWFDAPIGYLSMTAAHTQDWKQWWQNPESVELYQFMGKDNVAFHSILFPAMLLGTQKSWTLPHTLSVTEYLNYENDKFSKSRNVGVFGNDAMESGIPADYWRYYLFSIRPEQQDTSFSWPDFQAKINHELSANFGNLAQRALSFIQNKWGGTLPEASAPQANDLEFIQLSQAAVETYLSLMEKLKLREGLLHWMSYAKNTNRYFQEEAPWKSIQTEPKKASRTLHQTLIALRNLSLMAAPFLPESCLELRRQLNLDTDKLSFDEFQKPFEAHHTIQTPSPLFKILEPNEIQAFAQRFSGKNF